MKKVYVIAYCRNNIGDDLFVQALVRRYPRTRFYLFLDPKFRRPFLQEKNLSYPCRLTFLLYRVLKKLGLVNKSTVYRHFSKKAYGVIRIGGSVFIEPRNWDGDRRPQNTNCNPDTFYIGANFGPYRSQSFLEDVRGRLEGVRDCCFRDQYSRNLFRELPNVRYAPDVLFGYPFYPPWQKGEGVGISVIALEDRPELSSMKERYYDTLAKLCDLCQAQKIPVMLFSFCLAEGDARAVEEIRSRTHSEVRSCSYHGDTAAFLEQLNGCQCLLATRFHAMVLGWCMGKPVLPILYSLKQTHVLEEVGFRGKCWDLLSSQDYAAESLLQDCLKNDLPDIKALAAGAAVQFDGVDRFLNKELA